MPENCHYLTALHAHSHPCLVSLLFIPSLYSTFFNLKNFLFTCLYDHYYQLIKNTVTVSCIQTVVIWNRDLLIIIAILYIRDGHEHP